jgi:hypothetical protein
MKPTESWAALMALACMLADAGETTEAMLVAATSAPTTQGAILRRNMF